MESKPFHMHLLDEFMGSSTAVQHCCATWRPFRRGLSHLWNPRRLHLLPRGGEATARSPALKSGEAKLISPRCHRWVSSIWRFCCGPLWPLAMSNHSRAVVSLALQNSAGRNGSHMSQVFLVGLRWGTWEKEQISWFSTSIGKNS